MPGTRVWLTKRPRLLDLMGTTTVSDKVLPISEVQPNTTSSRKPSMTTQLSWDLRIALCDWVCFPGTSAQVGLSKWQPSSHQHQYPPSSSSTRDNIPWSCQSLACLWQRAPKCYQHTCSGPYSRKLSSKNPNSQNLQVEGTGSPPEEASPNS